VRAERDNGIRSELLKKFQEIFCSFILFYSS